MEPSPSPNAHLASFAKDLYTLDLLPTAFTKSDVFKNELKPAIHEAASSVRPFVGLRKKPLLKINAEATGFHVGLLFLFLDNYTDLPM